MQQVEAWLLYRMIGVAGSPIKSTEEQKPIEALSPPESYNFRDNRGGANFKGEVLAWEILEGKRDYPVNK